MSSAQQRQTRIWRSLLELLLLVIAAWFAYHVWTFNSSEEMQNYAIAHPMQAASVCDPTGPAGLMIGVFSAALVLLIGGVLLLVLAIRRRRKFIAQVV